MDVKNQAIKSLSGYMMNAEKERFKADALVDYVVTTTGQRDVNHIVRQVGRLIQQAQVRFPKHGPLDAAYLWLKDGQI